MRTYGARRSINIDQMCLWYKYYVRDYHSAYTISQYKLEHWISYIRLKKLIHDYYIVLESLQHLKGYVSFKAIFSYLKKVWSLNRNGAKHFHINLKH